MIKKIYILKFHSRSIKVTESIRTALIDREYVSIIISVLIINRKNESCVLIFLYNYV